jgi:sialic acid synthase SpsE
MTLQDMNIAGTMIEKSHKTFLIAEVAQAHERSLFSMQYS